MKLETLLCNIILLFELCSLNVSSHCRMPTAREKIFKINKSAIGDAKESQCLRKFTHSRAYLTMTWERMRTAYRIACEQARTYLTLHRCRMHPI